MKLKLPLIAAFVAILSLTACGGGDDDTPPVVVESPATLVKTDTLVGTGADATGTRLVTVHYTLFFYSSTAPNHKGAQIETSRTGSPYTFRLASNAVIPGFEAGVLGMKVGGTRRVEIPSAQAYGAAGSPPVIPPNAGLVFDIELMASVP
jgi:FKBP-type peptidyl-prolyl cis-trans isomerase FkpA